MKKKIMFVAAAMSVALVFAGCGNNKAEEVETKGDALRRELQIKRLTRSEKMAIIKK